MRVPVKQTESEQISHCVNSVHKFYRPHAKCRCCPMMGQRGIAREAQEFGLNWGVTLILRGKIGEGAALNKGYSFGIKSKKLLSYLAWRERSNGGEARITEGGDRQCRRCSSVIISIGEEGASKQAATCCKMTSGGDVLSVFDSASVHNVSCSESLE